MTKHYILSIDPQASHEWDKCTLRNPITGERPDLLAEIAQAVGNQAGSYLLAVNIEVEILEKAEIASTVTDRVELPAVRQVNSRKQLIAS